MNAPLPPDAIHVLPLAQIAASATNPRKRFDPAAMAELTESIRSHGVVQPVLVRPWPATRLPPSGKTIADTLTLYELVAGERRWRAAQAAALAQIPAFVRELTDAQALEIQVIENLQREDLHPLEEAEGYEQLMRPHGDRPGYTAEQIAEKIGKSRSYVYGRLKLTALCQAARDAFYAGEIDDASTALLIARIPSEKLQIQALEEITDEYEPMSFRMAKQHVLERYTLRLAEAPFPRGDADLIPGVPRCHECPKRSGSQPELFADIKSADICTDPDCHAAKKKAHFERQIETAKSTGQKVLTGKAAEKVMPYGKHSLA